jgi:hypothetical protein
MCCNYRCDAGCCLQVLSSSMPHLRSFTDNPPGHRIFISRSQVPVPAAWIDKLLPGIFTLQQQVHTQAQQTSNKRDLDKPGLLYAHAGADYADRHADPSPPAG